MVQLERYEARQGATATVELTPDAVLGKATRDVAAQVKDAMQTLRRLPMPREVRGMGKLIASLYAVAEQSDDQTKRRRSATPEEISRSDRILNLLYRIDDVDARKVLVARGMGLRWEWICDELDVSESTARRRHNDGLIRLLRIMLEEGAKNG